MCETRVLFLTERIVMRQAMSTPDVNSTLSVVDGCAVLLLDEVLSGSSDMELILARILPKLRSVTNFKVVLLSATLEIDDLVQRAYDAGLEDRFIQTMDTSGRHQRLESFCLSLLMLQLKEITLIELAR